MPLDTNLNVAPFYDDYNEEKNFHRVLFRPAVPVQARELTQLQSILQNQFERFGDNIYKQGTILKGCTFTFDYNYYYIKILDLQVDGQTAVPSNYVNAYAIHLSSNLQSLVVNSQDGLESQDPDTNMLFVKYLNTGSGDKKTFANSDVIRIYDRNYPVENVTIDSGGTLYSNNDTLVFSGGGGSGVAATLITYANGTIRSVTLTSQGSGYETAPSVAVTTSTGTGAQFTVKNYIADVTVANSSFNANSTSPTGLGSAATVADGVIYQKGNFVRVEEQTTIIDKFSPEPDGLVLGFNTLESVVNNSVDTSLLDNAQGYSNFTAPGAYRLKLTPSLVVKTKADAAANTEFFSLLEYERGKIVRRRTETEFNSIGSKLARRTAEESGDYVVRPFNVYAEEISGNTTHIDISVGSGIGYVDGYRIEIEDLVRTPIRKGTDTANLVGQVISTNYGNYVLINEMLGNFDFTSGNSVNLRNAAATDVTDNYGGGPTTPGSLIGTAKIRSLVYHSGSIGTPSAVYRLYLFDISLNPGFAFEDVLSIQSGSGTADCVLDEAGAQLRDTDFDSLVFSSGVEAVKQFTNEEFIYRTAADYTFDGSGTAVISLTGSEYFPYTASAPLNDIQTLDFIVVPASNVVSTTTLSGTLSTSGNTITGVGTSFISELDEGDYVKFSGDPEYFRVSSIISATSMKVAGAGPASLVSNTYTLAFPKNIPIRLDRGSANVNIDGARQQATIFLGNTIATSVTSKIYYDIQVSNATPKTKTVKKEVFVKLSTRSLSANTTGPWCLGVPDVYSIDAVYVGTGNTYSSTTTNYKNSFELISGQTDNVYKLASIRKKPGGTLALTSSSCLLVKLSCFTHGPGYYISTESYPVNDTNTYNANTEIRTQDIPNYLSPTSGRNINLRDAIDFRPIVANTANVNATTVAGATIDPSRTNTLTGTLYFPTPNKEFEAEVEHFLRRADRVIFDQFGQISVVEGVPSVNPEPPKPPDTGMCLGTVHIPPYPTLSPKEAKDSKRPEYATLIKQDQVRNYTMSDIRKIEDRISKLEYYSLLSLLEKNATDLVIPSEANTSLNRFKNGFFADSFASYDISDTNSPEYLITIDPIKGVARPQLDARMIDLVANTSASSNLTFKGDLATLGYSHKLYTEQPLANRQRRVTQSTWNYKGSMQLYPPYDNFYDTTTSQLNFTIDLATPLNNIINAINQNPNFRAGGTTIAQSSTAWNTVSTNRGVQTQQSTTTTTTTTTQNQLQAGSTVSNTQEVGDFVTDFALNPYIRPQWVSFIASGLRPGTKHYVFFDKRPVSSLTYPAEFNIDLFNTSDSTKPLDGTSSTTGYNITGALGEVLVANTLGMVAGTFYIEEQKYFCGDREVLLIDVDDYVSADTTISRASCLFSAFNFTKDMATLSVTTKKPGNISNVLLSNTQVSTTTNRRTVEPPDPLAQTFAVSLNDGSGGIYITKVDLYFSKKDPNLGLTVQIRECDPASGSPTPSILAQKIVPSKYVNVSNNSSVVTTVTFNSPVYVRHGRDYAIVLMPDGDSPEYLVWSAEAGNPDILTNVAKNKDWGDGSCFLSANDRVWTPLINEDIKFKVYCADFSNNQFGTVVFENDNMEFMTLANTQGSFEVGESIAQKANTYLNTLFGNSSFTRGSGWVVTTTNNISSTVTADDYLLIVYGNNAVTATGTVTVASSNTTVTGSSTTFSTQYAVDDFICINNQLRQVVSIANNTQLTIDAPLTSAVTSNTHLSITETFQVVRVVSANTTTVTLKNKPKLAINNSTVFASAQKVVRGILSQKDVNDVVIVKDSNASNSSFLFQAGKVIFGDESQSSAVISSIDNSTFSFIEPHIMTNIPATSSITLTQRADRVSGAASNNAMSFGVSNKTVAVSQIRSKSNEITQLSGAKSFKLYARLTRNADTILCAPVIDISPVSILTKRNIINNSSEGEHTSYGNSQVRYVSKRVVLADKLDAEDMRVYLTAYKPSGSSILVYSKILSGVDTEDFNDKGWTLLEQVTEAGLYSDNANELNYIEYEYAPKLSPPSTTIDGRVQTFSNTTLRGVGTDFTLLANNDLVKIVGFDTNTDYEVNIVESVANTTSLTLKNAIGPFSNTTATGLILEKITQPEASFKYDAGDGAILRYYNSSGSLYTGYKTYAIKVVLLSNSDHSPPILKDIRALAVSL
jgi:hypothetical protein